MSTKRGPWNHNIHYHRELLAAVSRGAESALDVGCGEGMLAREASRIVPRVVAIDSDRASIEDARANNDGVGVEYVLGDFLTYPFPPASFDVVLSVATLHHVDAIEGLSRMQELLRPGGTLAVLGLARSSSLADLPFELAGVLASRYYRLSRQYWEHPSPKVWPPPETYPSMRRIAAEVLPGVRFRRHALWRYSLIWTKPLHTA